MGITRITQEQARTMRGATDMKRLNERTEEETLEAARSDPDCPPLTQEQLEQFKRKKPHDKDAARAS